MNLQKQIFFNDGKIKGEYDAVRLIGAKALGLYELETLGVKVPLWAVITTDFFQSTERGNKSAQEFEVLKTLWDEISEKNTKSVAVRSSASFEDGADYSFAGQMDTFLNVKTFKKFLESVRLCRNSLYGERAVLYRVQNNMSPFACKFAVIVQQMIEADASGVVFTANPVTGDAAQTLINGVWGLGEGLVSGALSADMFILDASGEIIKREIAEKKQMLICDPEGSVKKAEVAKSEQNSPCLKEETLKELYYIGQKVQKLKKTPVDIEFAVSGKDIFFLQARPITGFLKPAENGKDNFKIWDNSNISESYSGVTTPLTFSFIKKAYAAVYSQFWETIGVDKKTIFKNRHILENMLGLIEGRVYYNLLNWYKLISLMPGFNYNKSFMEQMMGLQVIPCIDVTEKNIGWRDKYFFHMPRLVKVALKMIWAYLVLPKKIAEFHENFDEIYARYSSFDFTKCTASEIQKHYHILEDQVLWKWKAPILNDLAAMIFYGVLRKLTVNWGIDPNGALHNDLLCGVGNIKSADAVKDLFNIARKISGDAKLKRDFIITPPQDALKILRTDPAFLEINGAFNEYLKKYGARAVEEMKLESIPMKDDPVFCVSVMQNYLKDGAPDFERQQVNAQNIGKEAEKAVKKKFGKNVIKLWLYNWVLKNTRFAVKNRENQRFARTQIYDIVRNMFRAIGAKWEKDKIIENIEDIFYLQVDEIWSFVDGTAVSVDLKELIKIRKAEFQKYRESAPDDHLETFGEVYARNFFKKESVADENPNILKGLGCRQGLVENEVVIVLKPDKNLKLDGKIMVARQTDPGWTVLFPSVSGIIVERGSMLSHCAIVAREMGIPCVVGVKDAAKILKTGDRVLLNGSEGTIQIVNRKIAAAAG